MFSLETGFRKPTNAGEKVVVASSSNNVLFLGTDAGRLLRWDILHDDLEEIKLTRAPKDQPRRIFPDYESRDFIVSFGTADNYYVKESSRHNSAGRLSFGSNVGERPRALGRIRGVSLTAAHFMPLDTWRLFRNNSDPKTPPSEGGTELSGNRNGQRLILLGSDNGVVLGLIVDIATGKDENVFKLWNVPGAEMVYGIRGEIVSNVGMEKVYAFATIVCTNNRLYQFVGDANLEIFEKNPHILEITPVDSEMGHKSKAAATNSSSTLPQSPNVAKPNKPTMNQRLYFFTLAHGRRAQKFCWTTGAGIIHGELDWKRVIRSHSSSVIMNKALIRLDGNNSPRSSVLLAASLTEFYVVLLYSDRVVLVNQLSGKIFQELNISFTSSLRSAPPQFASIAPSSSQMTRINASDMVQDIVNNSLWIYANNGYFLRLSCDNEEEGIWKVALSVNRFDVAMRLSQTEEQARQVFLAQADWLADVNGAYKEAAKLYAKTNKPMEEVLLKLLEAPWTASCGEPNPIMEYLLSRLDQTSLDLPMQRTIIATLILEEYCKELYIPRIVDKEVKEPLEEDLNAFLQDHWKDLDLKTSFFMLLSHGLWDAAVTLSICSKKLQNAIQICIQNKAYNKALDIMKQTDDPEMFSKFAGFLSLHVPEELASTALLNGKEAVIRVVPALLRTFHFSSNENIRRKALYGCLELLETLNDDPYYCKLIFYLYALDKNEDAALESFQSVYPKLELQQLLDYCIFAMRCCHLGNFSKGCVQIFQSLGMFGDAVELACRIDSSYAKEIVSELTNVVDNIELVRKFWLRVALAVGGSNPSSLVKVVEDSNGILQMEHVMPFMEDFLEMDEEVKNAVCSSLVRNQSRIESAMEVSSRAEGTVEELYQEMEELKKKEKTLKHEDASYYLRFPCGHYFYDKESVLSAWTDLSSKDNYLYENMHSLEGLEGDKEENIVEECPLCGENMIETIDHDISLS